MAAIIFFFLKKSIFPKKAEKKRGTHKLGRYYCGQNRARSFLGSLRHFLKHALKESDQQIHTTFCILVVTVIINSIILIIKIRFIHLMWLSPTRTVQLQNPQKKKCEIQLSQYSHKIYQIISCICLCNTYLAMTFGGYGL